VDTYERAEEWEERIPTGVFYRKERPVYRKDFIPQGGALNEKETRRGGLIEDAGGVRLTLFWVSDLLKELPRGDLRRDPAHLIAPLIAMAPCREEDLPLDGVPEVE